MIGEASNIFSWDEIGLTATRLFGIIACSWVLFLLARMLFRSHYESARAIVPRPIVYFTMGWAGILMFIQTSLVLVDAEAVQRGWLRAVYGSAFIWTIVGLAWIVSIGAKGVMLGAELAKRVRELPSGDQE